MTDPRVEAMADPICRMLGHGPIDRAPPMIADAVRGRARGILVVADDAAWQSIETVPENTTVVIWSKEHVQNGQEPYPGGGWHRTLAGGIPKMHIGAFVDLGYTHWSLPLRPPSADGGAAQDEGSVR